MTAVQPGQRKAGLLGNGAPLGLPRQPAAYLAAVADKGQLARIDSRRKEWQRKDQRGQQPAAAGAEKGNQAGKAARFIAKARQECPAGFRAAAFRRTAGWVIVMHGVQGR